MAPFGSSAMKGRRLPKASECITTRRYAWRPAASLSAKRARRRAIASARFSSSAAFMFTKSASEPAAAIAAFTSSTWASPARKSRWIPQIR
jgi:hypothetical protein